MGYIIIQGAEKLSFWRIFLTYCFLKYIREVYLSLKDADDGQVSLTK